MLTSAQRKFVDMVVTAGYATRRHAIQVLERSEWAVIRQWQRNLDAAADTAVAELKGQEAMDVAPRRPRRARQAGERVTLTAGPKEQLTLFEEA